MPTNADVISLQMEKVRPKLQELFETSNLVSAKVKRGSESEKISTRDHRIPLQISRGGRYGTYDPDGGDLGRGSGPKFVHFISSYFPTKIGFELTNLQMDATAASEQAVAKVFAKTLSSGMQEYQVYDDFSLHGYGDGVFARATAQATVGGKTVFTLDTTTATQLCRRDMPCHVYDATLATQRTTPGTPVTIDVVDVPGNKVTLSATVAGAAATDKLLFDGVSGATPAWKRGLYLFNSNVSSGSLLSLSRTSYPEIISSYQNGGGNLLNAAMGLALIDQMTQRRDNIANLEGIAHMKQRTAWYTLGIQISEWQRGKSDEMLDIVPNTGKNATGNFTYCGINHIIDKHQQRTRIDWVDYKLFGRSILKDVDYHTVEGRKLFEVRGASGGVATAMLFYLTHAEDFYCVDPGALGYIDSLAIPTA